MTLQRPQLAFNSVLPTGPGPLLSGLEPRFPPPANRFAHGSRLRVRLSESWSVKSPGPAPAPLGPAGRVPPPSAPSSQSQHPIVSLSVHLPLCTPGPLEHRVFLCTPRAHMGSGIQDFPDSTVDGESAGQSWGRGFDPWSRKIPHVVGQTKSVGHNY